MILGDFGRKLRAHLLSDVQAVRNPWTKQLRIMKRMKIILMACLKMVELHLSWHHSLIALM
jgi:hypothetical protein